jgi:hypothetical protein
MKKNPVKLQADFLSEADAAFNILMEWDDDTPEPKQGFLEEKALHMMCGAPSIEQLGISVTYSLYGGFE